MMRAAILSFAFTSNARQRVQLYIRMRRNLSSKIFDANPKSRRSAKDREVERDKSRHFVTDTLQLLQNGYKETRTETAARFSKRQAGG